jgi:hypothetical protein
MKMLSTFFIIKLSRALFPDYDNGFGLFIQPSNIFFKPQVYYPLLIDTYITKPCFNNALEIDSFSFINHIPNSKINLFFKSKLTLHKTFYHYINLNCFKIFYIISIWSY